MKVARYDGDGRRELDAANSDVLGYATGQDRLNLGAGGTVRLRVAAAVRREMAAIRAEAQPRNTTTTTTSGEDPSRGGYTRSHTPARTRG